MWGNWKMMIAYASASGHEWEYDKPMMMFDCARCGQSHFKLGVARDETLLNTPCPERARAGYRS